MATQAEASHNSRPRSSGKNSRFSTTRSDTRHLPLAAEVARKLGIIATWANVQTIRLAIESEAALTGVALLDVAEMIVRAGKEWTRGSMYSCPSEFERREIFRLNAVDRFWFEDARWRSKDAYAEFCEQLRKNGAA
jgi:hypothetical protein